MIDTTADPYVETRDHLLVLADTAAAPIWEDYVALERAHLRTRALGQLERFIDVLLREPDKVRKQWVISVCRIMFDHPDSELHDTFDRPESRIIVRFPLVEKILVPELIDLFATETIPFGRWLYHLGGHRLGEIAPELCDESGFVDKLDFLKSLLKADPDDYLVGRLLICEMHQAIALTDHHYTEEEKRLSDDFRRRVLEFLELVVRYGERDRWSNTIDHYSSFLRRCT